MNTLAEIEAAAGSLPPEEKEALFLFLAAHLREAGHHQPPRAFSRDQVQAWIADDEEGMHRFQQER